MQFGTGLGGSVVGGLYGGAGGPGTSGMSGAGGPDATAGPTGRTSLMAAAFGNDESGSPAGNFAGIVGVAAWVGLIYLWWVLPK